MSVGPVSGNGIAINLPNGKTAFWTVNVQASYVQFVQLKDSKGTVVFQASGASTGGHSPTQIGYGTFTIGPNSPYMIYIGYNNGTSWSSVIWDSMTVNFLSTIICDNLNFISEDGADQDYNDSAVSISWFNSIG